MRVKSLFDSCWIKNLTRIMKWRSRRFSSFAQTWFSALKWNMKTKTKILIHLILLAIFDLIIPLPITAVILIYVLFNRPVWFKKYVKDIYRGSWKLLWPHSLTLTHPIHKILPGSDMVIVENLANLNQLHEEAFEFSCFPLHFQQADGSPIRAVASI